MSITLSGQRTNDECVARENSTSIIIEHEQQTCVIQGRLLMLRETPNTTVSLLDLVPTSSINIARFR
jgi:hypothetical protein